MFRFIFACCLLVVASSIKGHLPEIIEKKVGEIEHGIGKVGDTLIKTLDKGRDGMLDVQGKIGEVGDKLIQKFDKGKDTIVDFEEKIGEKVGELGEKIIQKFDKEGHITIIHPTIVQTVIRETVYPSTDEGVVEEIHVKPVFTDIIVQPAVDLIHVHPVLDQTCTPQTNVLVVTRHSIIPFYDVVTSFYSEPAYQYQLVTTVISTWTETQFVETTVSLLPQVSRYTSTLFSPAFTTQVNTIQAIEYELVPVHVVVTERDTDFLVVTQTDIQMIEVTNTAIIVETIGVPAYLDGSQAAAVTITESIFEAVYHATATTTVVLDDAIHYTVTVPEYVTVLDCSIDSVTKIVPAGFDVIHDPSYSYITETHYDAHPGAAYVKGHHDSFHTHTVTGIFGHTNTYTKTRYETNTFTDVVYHTVSEVSYSTSIPVTTVAPGGIHKVKAFLKRVVDQLKN